MNKKKNIYKKLNRNDILIKWLFRISKLSVIYLLLFMLFRIVFVTQFSEDGLSEYALEDIFKTFIYGASYDIMVISCSVLPLLFMGILAYLLKLSFVVNGLNFFARIYSSLIGSLFTIVLSLNLVFYALFKDNINRLILEFDVNTFIKHILERFQQEKFFELTLFIIIILILICFFSSFQVFSSFKKEKSHFKPGLRNFLVATIVGGALFLGAIRGGYSERVLSPSYFSSTSDSFLNTASYNGILSAVFIARDYNNLQLKNINLARKMGYKKSIKDAFSDYLGFDVSLTKQKELFSLLERKTGQNTLLENKKPHVVIVVNQNFHSGLAEFHSEKFSVLEGLEKHFKDDYYFENFVNGQRRSVSSLLSIVSNIPYIPETEILSEGKYLQTRLTSAANQVYKKNGYETTFLYGGALGYHGIGKYMRKQQFHKVLGARSILKNQETLKEVTSSQVVTDEYLYSFILKSLEVAKRPQFIIAMTAGADDSFKKPRGHTYSLFDPPAELVSSLPVTEKFLKGFELFKYSNRSLSAFIEELKAGAMGQKTVFAMTGTSHLVNLMSPMNTAKREAFKKHLVPFYVYLPENLKYKSVDLTKIGSHEDIMTTLYNVSLSNAAYLSFGENLMTESEGYAMNPEIYASSKGVVWGGEDYKWDTKPYIIPEKEPLFLNSLRRQFRSTVSLADFYLKSMYLIFRKEKKY